MTADYWDRVADTMFAELDGWFPPRLQLQAHVMFGEFVLKSETRRRRYEVSHDERLLLVHEFVLATMLPMKTI